MERNRQPKTRKLPRRASSPGFLHGIRLKLIAGLGNPGPQYAFTRHNAGFMVADFAVERFGSRFGGKRYGSGFAEYDGPEGRIVIIKPMKFMNRSGGPVTAWMRDLEIEPDGVLVVHDDIDLPLGEVRYKTGGGHGGHNGLRSIFDSMGSREFHRIRMGVGRPPDGVVASDHVLGEFNKDELEEMVEAIQGAVDIMEERFITPQD